MTFVINKEPRFLTAGAIWKSPFLDSGAHRAPLQLRVALALRFSDGTLLAIENSGGVVEWFMAPVLKTGKAQAFVGSNPTPSASFFFIGRWTLSVGRSAFSSSGFASCAVYRVKAREVCILNVGHSRSRARASYPNCVTAYPRGSRSRVFYIDSSNFPFQLSAFSFQRFSFL